MTTTALKASTAIAFAFLLAGCETTQSPRAEAHLSQRWEGKPVQDFEDRFGSPTSRSGSKLVWQTTREEVTPAHERSVSFGVSGVAIGNPMTNKVSARTERKTCTIEVTSQNGTIAHIDIVKDDSTRQAASLCLLTFG